MSRPGPAGAEAVSPGLRALVKRLWTPTGDRSDPVEIGYGRPPCDRTIVESYVVVPSLARARFLVPTGVPSVSRSAFSRHLTTSSTRTRALGHVSAAVFGTGIGERVFGSRLYVGIDPRIDRGQWQQWLLLSHLAAAIGVADVVAYLPIRRAGPNSKPTMQLFDRAGHARGYAKVGWSPATREVVRNEAGALRQVAGRLRQLQVPALAAAGEWHDRTFTVAESLPPGVRPWRAEPSTTPDLMHDIADAGQRSRTALATSRFASRVRRELEASAGREPQAARVLLDWLTRLERRSTLLEFGRWHGDFVPWNLGQTPAGPVAWDWEFSDEAVPVGFDLLHWHFQHRLSPDDAALGAAVAVADEQSWRLSTLGVPSADASLVTSLYLLEMFTRNTRMAALGAGWNRKYFPDLLRVADSRDR